SRALDLQRSLASRRRTQERVEAEPAPPVDAPPALVARKQLGERVRAALDTLEPHQRSVLEIAYFEGLSQSEIAARLEAPLGTVKSWTRQALDRLRTLLPQEDWS